MNKKDLIDYLRIKISLSDSRIKTSTDRNTRLISVGEKSAYQKILKYVQEDKADVLQRLEFNE